MSPGAQNHLQLRATDLDLTGPKYHIWDFLFPSTHPAKASLLGALFQATKRQVGLTQMTLCPFLPVSELVCYSRVSLLSILHLSLEKITAGHHHPYNQLTPIQRVLFLTWSSFLSLPSLKNPRLNSSILITPHKLMGLILKPWLISVNFLWSSTFCLTLHAVHRIYESLWNISLHF